MSRKTPPGRVQHVARVACEVFIEKGYRRALMTDVAERLELSHALLYRYVASKEALLELAARYAMDQDANLEALVPLATPPQGQILELIRGWLDVRATFSKLHAALEREPGEDAAAELTGIIDQLYDFVEQNRLLLLLIESLADDYPELNESAVNDRKRVFSGQVTDFLASRSASGGLRSVADPEIAAHFLIESIAWFAQSRKRDPNVATIDDQRTRSSVRELLLAAFVHETKTGVGE
jgi:AcrR family transcriptional regulator